MLEKLKSALANDQIFQVFLIFLVGLLAFGLGRWSVVTPAHQTAATISILDQSTSSQAIKAAPTNPPTTVDNKGAVAPSAAGASGGQESMVVASKNGARYHLPTCPGAKQIKPENLISFSSPAAAEAAGYSPATNCPGL